MEKIKDWLRLKLILLRGRTRERYIAALALPKYVISRTFRRVEEQVVPADPEQVRQVAASLEAALVMLEGMPGNTEVSLSFQQQELASFVCYVRQLDLEYRKLADVVKTYGSVAQVRPDLYPGERTR